MRLGLVQLNAVQIVARLALVPLAITLPLGIPSAALGAESAPQQPPAAKTVAAAGTPSPAKAPPAQEIDLLDWPCWRGPEQNGISRETDLVDRWDPDDGAEGNVLWKSSELGGISSPIVLRGKLYTIVRHQPGTNREQEKVVCVDAATGEKIWENKFNVYLSDVPAERVGWSSCVGDPTTGRIFALGVCGLFQCLDGETGKTIWAHSLSEEYGLLSTYGGRTNVPVLFDDQVIISAVTTNWGDLARPAHRFMAFDKNTGETVWIQGTKLAPEDTTYSTPVALPIGGRAQLVFGSGDGGVWSFQPRTGKPIWWLQLSRRGINVSPVVQDTTVYISHAEENMDNATIMGAIVGIDVTKSGDITKTGEWRRAGGMDGKSSPIVIDGRVYACDDGGKMFVLDAKTLGEVCKPAKLIGTIVRSSPVYGDGKIYICTTSAWHVFVPTAKGVKLVHKLRLREEDEVSGSPAISHGRIYLPTGGNLYCIGKKDQTPQATPRPELATETPRDKDLQPALVQVFPCEVLLGLGQKQQFTARLYNANGQRLDDKPATFTLEGPGKIDNAGLYTAAYTGGHTGTTVVAKVGELVGKARIRVVPPLPWKFDFSDKQVPVTWIGARYRHMVREVDGEPVLVKVTTIPKGTRSQSWMGPTDLQDYTVQADVQGTLTNKKLPDIGLIAQRYTLDLMGAHQQIQIRSWTPQIETRFKKEVPFKWEGGKWYTIKFQASTQGSQAVLKGKVWPRDEKEPDEWTIEVVDQVGNLNGSPGLFGNANDAEIMLDNVRVMENEESQH